MLDKLKYVPAVSRIWSQVVEEDLKPLVEQFMQSVRRHEGMSSVTDTVSAESKISTSKRKTKVQNVGYSSSESTLSTKDRKLQAIASDLLLKNPNN